MYDLRTLRDNFDAIREQLGPRGTDVPWDRIRTLIEQRRTSSSQSEQLRHELKKGSEDVAKLKREKQPADAVMAAMKTIGERIKTIEDELRVVEDTLTDLNLRIPNVPHASVPAGKDAGSNMETRRWGSPPVLTTPAKSHWDLGETLGILDFDRAAKITGARFAVLTGAARD
jgi:Seryl-tRNA synthetase